MELSKEFKDLVCVYKITNVYNNKILIGSTINLYNRICHYRTDINKSNPLKHYNKTFYEDILKYGINSFIVSIVETFDNISNVELKNKESYYIKLYDSINPNIGYNLRLDIDGKYIVNESTRLLKRKQTTEQWKNGIRDNHSNKLKDYWKNNDERKKQQSKIMHDNLTKYVYNIYDINNNLLYNNIDYNKLVELNYNSAIYSIHRRLKKNITVNGKSLYDKNKIKVKTKNVYVERIKIND